MPAWPVPHIEPEPIEGEPVVGCFGHVNESKRIPQLLEAFERSARPGRASAPRRLVVAAAPELELPDARDPRGTTFPRSELWSLLAASDVVVSLRSPTMGETSAAAVRALSLGKPLVVSDVGWFSELPGRGRDQGAGRRGRGRRARRVRSTGGDEPAR